MILLQNNEREPYTDSFATENNDSETIHMVDVNGCKKNSINFQITGADQISSTDKNKTSCFDPTLGNEIISNEFKSCSGKMHLNSTSKGPFRPSVSADSSLFPATIGAVVWAKLKEFPWWPCIVVKDSSCGDEFIGNNMKSKNNENVVIVRSNYCVVSTLGTYCSEHSIHNDHVQHYHSAMDYNILNQETRLLRNCIAPNKTDKSQMSPKKMRQAWKRAILDANELKSVLNVENRLNLFFTRFPNRKYLLPEVLVRTLHFERKPDVPLVWRSFAQLSDEPSSLHLAIQNSRKRKLASNSKINGRREDFLHEILSGSHMNFDTDSSSESGSVDGRKAKQKMKSFSAELAPFKVTSTLEALNKNPSLKDYSKSLSNPQAARGRPLKLASKRTLESTIEFTKDSEKLDAYFSPVDWSSILSNVAFFKNSVCVVCELAGELLLCRVCVLFYHRNCYQYLYNDDECPENAAEFTCKECRNGEVFCFACMEEIEAPRNDESVLFCSIKLCRKYYHRNCAEKFKVRLDSDQESENQLNNLSLSSSECSSSTSEGVGKNEFVCPQHVCATCYVADPHDLNYSKGKFIKCHRCPLAYHSQNDEACIPAGSNIVSSAHLVCPLHFRMPQKNINVNWCFFCSEGGQLVCCEFCPAAFHRSCLPKSEIIHDQKHWLCENCRCGSFPKYGDVVWAKLAQFRFWPAQVVHPWLIPENVMRASSSIGEYVVYFFGTYNYSWLPGHRVFLYEQDDDKSRQNQSGPNGLQKGYNRGVQEAAIAYRAFCTRNEQKIIDAQKKLDDSGKPPAYKYMPQNRPVYPVKIKACAVEDNSVCSCKPTDEDPCGPESNCMNRITQFECHPATCPAGADRCGNQRFKMFQYSPTEIFRSDQKGWGLRATDDIGEGVFVGEYCGELIDEKECEKRVRQQNLEQNYNFYFCVLDRDRVIDASRKGNHLRFINHSCQPNCQTQVWTVNGDQRVGVFTLREIEKNEELTFNYNLETLGETKIRCFCGAPACSGYIGIKNKPTEETQNSKKVPGRQKKDNKAKMEGISDGEHVCFKCGKMIAEGGAKVTCGRAMCEKVYHFECVQKRVNEYKTKKWSCERHSCHICEELHGKSKGVPKRAVFSCEDCVKAACAQHATGFIVVTDMKTGQMKCVTCAQKTSLTNDKLFKGVEIQNESLTNSMGEENERTDSARPMLGPHFTLDEDQDLERLTSQCMLSLAEKIAEKLAQKRSEDNNGDQESYTNSAVDEIIPLHDKQKQKIFELGSDSETETEVSVLNKADPEIEIKTEVVAAEIPEKKENLMELASTELENEISTSMES